nr:zinc finger, CCHC-type, retrotransposon Gag domain protein [Tanacetum cinerariifolium]
MVIEEILDVEILGVWEMIYAQPIDIHVWLERFRKEKPQNFSSASTPVEVENWISHIEKIFEVLGCDDQFKARHQEEQAKHFKWGLNDFVLDRILKTKFTNVAQGSNPRADDQKDSDRYGNRGKNGNKDRYGTDKWRGDRQGSDKHGNDSDRHGNASQKAWRDQD